MELALEIDEGDICYGALGVSDYEVDHNRALEAVEQRNTLTTDRLYMVNRRNMTFIQSDKNLEFIRLAVSANDKLADARVKLHLMENSTEKGVVPIMFTEIEKPYVAGVRDISEPEVESVMFDVNVKRPVKAVFGYENINKYIRAKNDD